MTATDLSRDWSFTAPLLRCPVCRGPLRREGRALRCAHGHAFDLAREGYVNLVAPGRSAPRLAGDSPAMLRARRAFLDRGYYQPLSDALNAAVARHLREADTDAPVSGEGGASLGVLDAGCGEGYYLGRLGVRLCEDTIAIPLVGLDIAKEAVRLAAKRYPAARFLVADVNAALPFADAGMAVVMDVFAPRNPAEFARVLAPGGLLLVALPAPAHLAELRALVPMLGIEPDKAERVALRLGGDFTPAGGTSLTYPLALSGADAALALQMSPSARHLTLADLAGVAARDEAPATAAFELLAFRKYK
jgi:23S rRNA (guanine745-N1)-methyltransferase